MRAALTGSRIAFRCDGDDRLGAGHVARCIPLAAAFARLGIEASFVGRYAGLASWLLARAGMDVRAPDQEAPCGVRAEEHDAVVVDSYAIAPAEICELALALPPVTLAEANRCPTRGILLDYHLDRSEPPSAVLLAGPTFAPLDPAFAGAGRPGAEVRRVLVTVGGSMRARELLAELVPIVASIFADAQIVLLGDGSLSAMAGTIASRVLDVPYPCALVDSIYDVDLAVTAAGFTAYEIACAGIPQVAIAIVANQRRVVGGLRRTGLAPALDLTGGDSLKQLAGALERLRDVELRRRLAARGMELFDGRGAQRAAHALAQRFAVIRS